MRLPVLHLLFLLLLSVPALAINPLWVRMDKKIISEVSAVIKASPATAERYFVKGSRDVHNLGFGWKSKDGAVGGGYISIRATFYYRNDTLISYTVYPRFPDEPALKSTYAKLYAPSFSIDSKGLSPFYYNDAALSKPLSTYREPYLSGSAPKAIRKYMSPESGLEYGDYGGFALSMLQNRKNFIELQDSISTEQVFLMMHAVNPASRLTAIEYYLSNKKLFSNQPQIEQWMETVFQELPEVESMQGCIGGTYNARALVAKFSKAK